MNLTEEQEATCLTRWATNNGYPAFDDYNNGKIKSNVNSIVQCLVEKIGDQDKKVLLDHLIGYMMLLDSDYFLNEIVRFNDNADDEEERKNKEKINKRYQNEHPLRNISGELLKSQSAAKDSILATLRSGKGFARAETDVIKDSLVAAKSLNKNINTMTIFFVAMDIYTNLNKQSVEADLHGTVKKFLSKVLAEMESDAKVIRYRFEKNIDVDPDDPSYDEKVNEMFGFGANEIPHKVLEELSKYSYFGLSPASIKVIARYMSKYVWKDDEDKKKELKIKTEKKFLSKLAILMDFIHNCMRKQSAFFYDIDLDIYKHQIGKQLIDMLQAQKTYKTKRRENAERSDSKDDRQNDIEQWYYDVFFDNDFYTKYASGMEEVEKNLGDTTYEPNEKDSLISQGVAKQVMTDYDNAFSINLKRSGEHKYIFEMHFGVMKEDEQFFKEYVSVLRDYQSRLNTIAFMPFDDVLYRFVGHFSDIVISYDKISYRIDIYGNRDLSNSDAQKLASNEKDFMEELADDLAILQNPLKRVDIIDQLRSNKAIHKRSPYTSYQDYIYKLYLRMHPDADVRTTSATKPEATTTVPPSNTETTPSDATSTDSTPATAPAVAATTVAPAPEPTPTPEKEVPQMNLPSGMMDVLNHLNIKAP